MPHKHTFSACWTDELGEVIKKEAALQVPDGYHIEMHSFDDEWDAIVKAINKGIDAHLEAVQFKLGTGEYGKNKLTVTPDTIHVLVRRLMESGDERAELLGMDICGTLDIELI